MEQPERDVTSEDVETKARILSAARRVLSSRGVGGLSIAAIANEADVYRAAVSYHFGSKKKLLVSLVQTTYRTWAQRAAANSRRIRTEEARIGGLIEDWTFTGDSANDLLFFETLGYATRDPQLDKDLKDFYAHWTDVLADLLSSPDVQASEEQIRACALLARMLIDGICVERIVNPDSEDWRRAAVAAENMLKRELMAPSLAGVRSE